MALINTNTYDFHWNHLHVLKFL